MNTKLAFEHEKKMQITSPYSYNSMVDTAGEKVSANSNCTIFLKIAKKLKKHKSRIYK